MPSRWIALGFLVSSPMLAEVARAQPPKPSEDERLLAEVARLPTDDASLLRLLRERCQSVDDLIRQLGNPEFARREQASRTLCRLGSAALPKLRANFANPDREIAQRTRQCAAAIGEHQDVRWVPAVVRLLAARKPAGSADALLEFLPFASDPEIEEEIYYALDDFAGADGKIMSQLAVTLSDSDPPRRALCACILAKRGDAQQKAAVATVGRSDPDAYVRLRAAQGLLAAGEAGAIQPLIDLLPSKSLHICWQADELLRWAAGETAPKEFVAKGSHEEKAYCHQAWLRWWKEHEAAFRIDAARGSPGGPSLVLAWPDTGARSFMCLLGSDGRTIRPENWNRDDLGFDVEKRDSGRTKLRDGSTIAGGFSQEGALSGWLKRTAADGRLVWEAFGPRDRAIVVLPLVRFGFATRGSVDTIEHRLKALKSPDVIARRNALTLLKKFPVTDAVFAAGFEALRDGDDSVCRLAVQLLARSPDRCEKVSPHLVPFFAEPNVGRTLVLIFKAMGPEKSVPLLVSVLKDKTSASALERRQMAILFLSRLPIDNAPEAAEAMTKALRDPESEIRNAVLRSIAFYELASPDTVRLGRPENAKLLLKDVIAAVSDPDKTVALQAIHTLGFWGAISDPAVPTILKAMEREELRLAAVVAFAEVGVNDTSALRKLLEYLGDQKDPEVLAAVANAVGKRGARAKEAVPALIKLLDDKRHGYHSTVQRHAASALCNIGPAAKEALPALRRMISSGEIGGSTEMWWATALGRIDPSAEHEVQRILQKTLPPLTTLRNQQ